MDAFRNDKAPRNHADSTLVTFYKRCIDERGRISRYLVNEVSTEALENVDEARSSIRALMIRIAPPPYPLKLPRGVEQFDHRLINQWSHRVQSLPVMLGRELGEKYELDRAGFYSELTKYVPVSKVFEQIFDTLPKVAKLSERALVFDEMKTLHEHRHWYGLYALALPHVEGLFTEILELAGPAERPIAGALPDKVRLVHKLVHKYAAAHAQNMDYFEFVVPIERNRFSHTGRVENAELRAIEILYDLLYVLRVYVELETPVIELLNLLDVERLTAAKSFAPLSRLFALLRTVDKFKQRDQVKARLERFWETVFEDEAAKREAVDMLCKTLEERIEILAGHLRTITREYAGLEVNIMVKKTHEAYEKRDQIWEAVAEATATSDNFFDALDVHLILRGMATECALPHDSREKIETTLANLKTALSNVDFLSTSTRPKPEE